MFNSASALLNSSPIGSALPRAPIRMSATCLASASVGAALAPIFKALTAVVSPSMRATVALLVPRGMSANCVGAVESQALLRCMRACYLQSSLLVVAAFSSRLSRSVSAQGSAVCVAAYSAQLAREMRLSCRCVTQAVTSATLGVSNDDVAPEERSAALPMRDNGITLEEGAMSILKIIYQQPADRLDYDIDCSPLVGDFDVVQSATATVSPLGLTVGAPTVFSDRLKLWISGGTDGVTYKVTVTVTTRDGRVQQGEIRVKIKEI